MKVTNWRYRGRRTRAEMAAFREAQRRRDGVLQRCTAMRAAKERKRIVAMADQPAGWPLVRAVWIAVYAAPDGRSIELHAASERGRWVRCGSERAVRGALAGMIYRMRGQPRVLARTTSAYVR